MLNKSLNKSVAMLLTLVFIFTLFPASLSANPLPSDIKGFNRSVFDSHFSRADREINPGRWFSEAEFGVTQAIAAWETFAFGMYGDHYLFKEAKIRVEEWSRQELEERFSKWLTGRFFGAAAERALLDFSQVFDEINKNYTWKLDSEGNIIFDDRTGSPLIIRPDDGREFSADLLMWQNEAEETVAAKGSSSDIMISGLFTELLAYIPNELRDSFNAVINETSSNFKGTIRQEFENLAAREQRIFTSRRTRDIQSLRKKSDDEAARLFTQVLISETEEICSRGTEALNARIEEAAAGNGDLALLGEDWLRLYREQFERGLKAWEEAEERFFIRRIEWEQASFKLFSEGEETWLAAFSQFEDERRKWELKAKELFDTGEAMFKNIGEDFEKSVAEARKEFEINTAMRIGEGTEKVKALVDMYLLCSSAAISVMENLQYWHDQYAGAGKINPKDPDFNAWLIREEARTKSVSLAEIRKSYDLYVSYMEKASDARDRILKNYAELIGTGALKDILSPDASSEDFHLDEYQVALIRAKALVLYWERKTAVTEAVLSYAEDLSAGRMTEAEGLRAWEEAKAAYNESILFYETELKKLDSIGGDIHAQKEILQDIALKMFHEEKKLNELNDVYSAYFNASIIDRADYYLSDLNQLYKYLEKEYISFLLSGTGAVYKTILEYGNKWDNAERREAAKTVLDMMINGLGQQLPSLAELEKLVQEGKESGINLTIRLAGIDLFSDNTSGADWYSRAKGFEPGDEEKASLYGEKLSAKLAEDYSSSSNILFEKRLELELNSLGNLLNLIPLSANLIFVPPENCFIDSSFASRVYQALLHLKERHYYGKPLLTENDNENEIINIFLSGGSFFSGSEQVLAEYYNDYYLCLGLYDLYNEYANISSFSQKELWFDSLNSMSSLLAELGVGQFAGFLPDIQEICQSIYKKNGDFILNAAQFLMEFDKCFSVMPKWLETETTFWKNALIEYIASFSYYINLNLENLEITLLNKQNELDEKCSEFYAYAGSIANYNDNEADKINRAYAEIKDRAVLLFYAEQIKQVLESINNNSNEEEKHWRQFITADYLKTEEFVIETVSARKDGVLKDASFKASYYSNRLKDSFEIYSHNNSEYTDENSALLFELYYEKLSELNNGFNLLALLQNEIASAGKSYEISKISPKEMESLLKQSHEALKTQEAVFNSVKNIYFHEAETFMNTGLLYDRQYSILKKAHEDSDKKRFEYEKQDAIQVWASTAYSGTEKYSIESCYSSLSRAQTVLAVLSDLYSGENRRLYEDAEYNALYSEYEQSFGRKIKIMETAETLRIAVEQEKLNNVKTYNEYHKSLMQLGGVDQDYINYISPGSRSQWGLKDIITLKDGRLVFSRDNAMRLTGIDEEKANALNGYFNSDINPDGERFEISAFEEAIRGLSQRMSGYLGNSDKYRQWGLARDYLIASLIKANADLSFLNKFYSGTGQLKNDSSLGNLLIKSKIFEKPERLSSNDHIDSYGLILDRLPLSSWQSLSEQEKSDLEFYVILTLSGIGNNYLAGFSQFRTMEMYQHSYNYVNDLYQYAEDEIDKWYKTVGLIIIIPIFGIPRIISLLEMRDLNLSTLERIEPVLSKTGNTVSKWMSGLQGNLSAIKKHAVAYNASCKKLDILEGKKTNGEKVVWDDIKHVFLAAEKINNADIKILESYWNLMLSESDAAFSDVSQALDGLLDWARNREEKNKIAVDARWQNDLQIQKRNDAILKSLTDEYMAGTVSIDTLKTAAENAYGKNAAAWKNHHENIYSVLLNDLSLYSKAKYDFYPEFSIPGEELAKLTIKLMENKFAVELASREIEWEQTRFDISEKYKEWQDSIAKILENGRADWNASVLKMEEAYKQWRGNFQSEYSRVSDEWALAYLAGLEDKEKWLEQAAMAANQASSESFLTLVGTEGERLSLFLDAREPMGIRGAIPETNSLMAELLRSSGIANLYSAFSLLNSAAAIASPLVRRGIGGASAWDASLTKAAATDMARKTNTEIADRESRKIANNVRLYAEEAINNLKQEVETANSGFRDSMDNYFILEGLWRKSGNNYEKNIIKGSTLITPVVNEAITVPGYKFFRMNHVSLKTNLGMDFLAGLDSITIMLLLENAEKEMGTIAAEIFGTGSDSIIIRKNYTGDRSLAPGKFGAHIGYTPAVKPSSETGNTKNSMFYDEGSGELGRLITEYIYWAYIDSKGSHELTLPPWDKRIWNDDGSFFSAPSLRSAATMAGSIAATVVSAALTPVTGGASLSLILATAAISTGIGAASEFVFSAMDYSFGYKTLDEATFSWGKSTLMSAVGNFGSCLFGYAGSVLTEGITSNIIKTAANTAITGVQNFTTGTINSALGAITYSRDDKWGFSGDAFSTGMKGVMTNSISSMTSAFTTGTLQGINSGIKLDKLSGFSNENKNNLLNLNGLIGSLAGQGVNYAMGSDFTLNVLNLNLLTQGAYNSGLVELNIGRDGAKMNLGTGGANVSLENLASSLKGAMVWNVNNKIGSYTEKEILDMAVALRAQYGFGDDRQTEQLWEILKGVTDIRLVDNPESPAQTIIDGKRTILLNSELSGLSNEDQMRLAVILGHEAYRDGYTTGDNNLETELAAFTHTEMALRMIKDGQTLSLDENLIMDIIAYSMGAEFFNQYADNYYDSSADYWKLLRNGTLVNDNSGWLTDETGKPILNANNEKIGASGIETGLLNILFGGTSGIKHDEFSDDQVLFAQMLMRNSGMKSAEGEKSGFRNFLWNNNEAGQSLNMQQIMQSIGSVVAAPVFARYYENDATSYALWILGKNPGYVNNASLTGETFSRFTSVLLPSVLNFYGTTRNFLDSSANFRVTQKHASDEYKYDKYENDLHFGTDFSNKKSGDSIYSGIPGIVILTAPEIKPGEGNGNWMVTEYGYMFEGSFLGSGIYGEYMHMENPSELKNKTYLTGNQIIGTVGNTGRSSGAHLHYSIYTLDNYPYSQTSLQTLLNKNITNTVVSKNAGAYAGTYNGQIAKKVTYDIENYLRGLK